MEKIFKPQLSTIPDLNELAANFEKWGQEFEKFLQDGGKSSKFSWKGGLYYQIRNQLYAITLGHCSFCDGYPIATISKETIEHYYPKEEFPLLVYDSERNDFPYRYIYDYCLFLKSTKTDTPQ